jgi:hypothetical protein
MAGGGVYGKVVGITHIIMTGIGFIISMFHVFILISVQTGEDIIETVIGMDTDGTISGFLTDNLNRIGRDGMIIGIGKGEEPGVSRTIKLDHNNRDKN